MSNNNYVVQLADPNAERPDQKRRIKSAKETLPAEFDRLIDASLPFVALPDQDGYAKSVGFTDGFPAARDEEEGRTWLVNTYGAVSAGREIGIDSGGGSELTVIIGHAPRQLDRNVTVVGRVRQGIEVRSSLPRGDGALGFQENGVMLIRSVRLASELPDTARTDLEVLRTEHALIPATDRISQKPP